MFAMASRITTLDRVNSPMSTPTAKDAMAGRLGEIPGATALAEARVLQPLPIATVAEILVGAPLHASREVQLLYSSAPFRLLIPNEIEIHCDNTDCGGTRRHLRSGTDSLRNESDHYVFAHFTCVNCEEDVKIFGLKCTPRPGGMSGVCTKIYQDPPFGAPIPKKLFSLIGEDNREHFLNARRAIARGLGIGAYAYYRRIVENSKFHLIQTVLEVGISTAASPDQLETLKAAAAETQFTKAVDMLRAAASIPAALLINGQNPLTLLHDALSEGIHQLSDKDCLERAQDAEVVLCELAERIQAALTDRNAVKQALSNIARRKGN
jgi:hypothetical protein